MGFVKKKKKGIKIVAITAGVVVFLGGIGGGFYLINHNYNVKLKQLVLSNTRTVYIPKEDVAFGKQLTTDEFIVSNVTSDISAADYMSAADIGKFAKSVLKKGLPVMEYEVSDEKIPDDLREVELNMLHLQSNLLADKCVDVRILFPNGEDFIVLSKKRIVNINLPSNTIWAWLNDAEIQTLNSAIVDAYINKGTKLYVTTYVEPSGQKNSITTYPANLSVQRLLKQDPNILDAAKLYLSAAERNDLENKLKKINTKDSGNVESSVNKESDNLQKTVTSNVQPSQTIIQQPQSVKTNAGNSGGGNDGLIK